jgi:hypothetical protein
MRMRQMSVLLGGLVLGAACETVSTGPDAEGTSFQGLAEGASVTFQAAGSFQLFTPPPEPGTRVAAFHLHASQYDLQRRTLQNLQLQRLGDELPTPGTFRLGRDVSVAGGFTAFYLHAGETGYEQFLATDGEVVITVATADRLEGTVRFDAARICSGTGHSISCTWDLSREVGPDAPRVRVTGSFTARPAG